MIHTGLRYLLILGVFATIGYGLVNFRGSNLRSPRYVTRPQSRFWWWGRLLSDDEWTPEGLVYRRRYLTWIAVSALTLIVLGMVW